MQRSLGYRKRGGRLKKKIRLVANPKGSDRSENGTGATRRPLSHSHINMLGRYQFNLPEELKDGALRPLRDVDALDELGDLDLW